MPKNANPATSPAKAASKAPVAPGSTAHAVDVAQLHSISVGLTLGQNVEGHPPRADSPEFQKARATLHKILAQLKDNFFGHGDGNNAIQAHHGGSLWLMGDDGVPFMMLNIVGIEWNEQFGANPAKVDVLRQAAKRVVDAFPKTRPWLKSLGYDPDPALDTPITDAQTLARYTDSIFNSCVPLPQKVHTGTLAEADANACGIHNYPLPAWGMNFIHRDDFKPFIPIGGGAVAHVAPVSHDPKDKRVRVLGVHGNTTHPLYKQHAKAEAEDKALALDADDPIAKQAFGG